MKYFNPHQDHACALRHRQVHEVRKEVAASPRLHHLDQGVLQHVLAVDDRADHARAIAMQPWPHREQQASQGRRVDGLSPFPRRCSVRRGDDGDDDTLSLSID
jgi:hypothetical protein